MSYAEVTRLVSTVMVSTVGPGMEATSDDDLTLADSQMSEENTELTLAVGEITDEETYEELIEKEMCEEKIEVTLENEGKVEENIEVTLENEEKVEEKTDVTLEKVEENTDVISENGGKIEEKTEIGVERVEEKTEVTLENEGKIEEKTEVTLENGGKVEENTEITLENEEKTDTALEKEALVEEKTELTLENMEMCEEKTELSLENKEIVENPGSTLTDNDISVKFKVILTEKEQSEINNEEKLEESLSKEVSENPSSLLERWATKLGLDSVPKKLAAGGAGGLLVGYLAGKAPKSAAVGVLGSLIAFRIAEHKGLLKKEKMMEEATSNSGHCPFQEFAAKNVHIVGGFTGGILVGIASSLKC